MKRTLAVAAVIQQTLSAVAFAQGTTSVPGYPDAQAIPVANTPAGFAAGGARSDGGSIRQQLATSLQRAGFTEVKIVPEAFLAQATNNSGNPVMMLISPDSLTVLTAIDAKGHDARTATGAAPATS